MHRSTRALAVVITSWVLFGVSFHDSWASAQPSCVPAITTTTQAIRRADGAIVGLDVLTQASASRPGGDLLVSVTFTRVVNGRVEVDGRVVSPPSTLALPSPRSWTFRVSRVDASQPFHVEYTVRDLCGDVVRFAGAGTADGRSTTASGPPAAPDPAGRITPDALRLTATYHSVGVEVPFLGDPNRNATASLSFRRAGESAWRAGLPLWPTADPSGPAFYGSALLLEPGTPYEVRVTIADPDGVNGNGVQTAAITTRAETIVPPEGLVPTHVVRTTGDDHADGRSPTSAWRTIDKAVQDAPSGSVVQVGPGYYSTSRGRAGQPPTARSAPLTLVTQYPAVDQGRQVAHPGLHSVIEPTGLSSPRGATDGPHPGVWQHTTLVGPRTGGTYTVWKWAESSVTDAVQLGYAASRAEAPFRVAHWKKDSADLATPAGWAEKLYANLTYNSGFYADGADLYLRLPGDRDPNTLYITASGPNEVGLVVNGPDIRISGFEIRQFTSGVELMWDARRAVIDRSLLTGNANGVHLRGNRAGTPLRSIYGGDHTIQENLIRDASLWSADPAVNPTVPWMFVKSNIRNADGSDYPTSRIGGSGESNGLGGRGGAQRVVVRRNTIDGPFNGVSTGDNLGFDRHAGRDMDIHDNLIRHLADDALEPELAAINFRAWNNRIEHSLTVLSTGPVHFGPIYLFRNTAWRTGNEGQSRDGRGRVPGSTMLKYSGKSDPPARLYVLHNTFWTDGYADGGALFASWGPSPEPMYLRNNLIRATHYVFDTPRPVGTWNEDYNHFATTDGSRGLQYGRVNYVTNVQEYRDASGQGGHTNVAGDFTTDVALVNAASGDLRLPGGSRLIDAGVAVPNVSDRPGVDFQGAAPDIGYERR